jgi:hypothetical protein
MIDIIFTLTQAKGGYSIPDLFNYATTNSMKINKHNLMQKMIGFFFKEN